MYPDFRKMQIRLAAEDMGRLVELAERECRDPRDQAAFLLRQALEQAADSAGDRGSATDRERQDP